jgi:hypothetical protein
MDNIAVKLLNRVWNVRVLELGWILTIEMEVYPDFLIIIHTHILISPFYCKEDKTSNVRRRVKCHAY